MKQEVFIPLVHRVGEARVDFGYALVKVLEFRNRRWQIPPPTKWCGFSKCRVKVCEHLDETLRIGFCLHTLGHYNAQGRLLVDSSIIPKRKKGVNNGTASGRPLNFPARRWGQDIINT